MRALTHPLTTSAFPVPGALLLLAAASFLLSSCGTIMHGSTQQVSISSTPSGGEVTVNGMRFGTTPVVADLKRKDQHTVRIDLEGYAPYELALSRSASGWVAGNILFGGIIGLAVDAITGGMYKLTPEQVMATLVAGGQGSDLALEPGDLVVFLVLQPESGWEPFATLERD